MNHILLLGAGFSRNWGGWTTEELIGDLLGRVAGAPDIQKRLQKVAFRNSATGNGNNFESVLNDLIIENRTQGTSVRNPADVGTRLRFMSVCDYRINRYAMLTHAGKRLRH